MKRKVIQIANSTQLVSLPRKWCEAYEVKKGDELEVQEEGSRVIISTDKGIDGQRIEINPPHLKNITERHVTTAFRTGVDEVCVNFNYDENPELLQYISKTLDGQTIGYEIIAQEKNYFVIKDLSGTSATSFDTALRRSFLLLASMAKESLEAIKSKNVANLKDMYFKDRSINKFTNFCGRLLLKKAQFDTKKTAFYYHFIRSFEALADQYSLMCTHYADSLTPVHKKAFEAHKQINDALMEFNAIFYEYDKKKLDRLFLRIRELEKTSQDLFGLPKSDYIVSHYLASIVRRIKEMVDSIIELNVQAG